MSHAKNVASAPIHDQRGGRVALLIIDMINCFDFPAADLLRPKALKAAEVIQDLRPQLERRGEPIIYVNDNFGEWHSERSMLVERALRNDNPLAEVPSPNAEDYPIVKPLFSRFYATILPVLLPKLGISRLILSKPFTGAEALEALIALSR